MSDEQPNTKRQKLIDDTGACLVEELKDKNMQKNETFNKMLKEKDEAINMKDDEIADLKEENGVFLKVLYDINKLLEGPAGTEEGDVDHLTEAIPAIKNLFFNHFVINGFKRIEAAKGR